MLWVFRVEIFTCPNCGGARGLPFEAPELAVARTPPDDGGGWLFCDRTDPFGPNGLVFLARAALLPPSGAVVGVDADVVLGEVTSPYFSVVGASA